MNKFLILLIIFLTFNLKNGYSNTLSCNFDDYDRTSTATSAKIAKSWIKPFQTHVITGQTVRWSGPGLSGKITTLITRDKKNRQLMTVSDVSGKKAITNYKTLKVFNLKDIPKISLIECELETGRTHQIRVHLKYKGSTLLGDKQYGKKNIKFKKINSEFFVKLNKLTGQALHAKTLAFIHPSTNKWISFDSKLPNGFKKILNLLENLSS